MPQELTANVRSLGFDLEKLVAQKKIVLDHVHIERSEIEETGEYDLEGLFIRLGHAIDSIGAKRVVLDTVEALFAGLPNHAILRAELRRLFRWLKDRGMTAVITGEKGEASITRYGLEEYVADCVIIARPPRERADFHASAARGEVSRLGAWHERISVSHRRARALGAADHLAAARSPRPPRSACPPASRGSTKCSAARASFAAAACSSPVRRARARAASARSSSTPPAGAASARCFSPTRNRAAQIMRNMRSIGIDLEPWVKKGLLQIHASRPTLHGLEQHLVMMHDMVRAFRPRVVAVDPDQQSHARARRDGGEADAHAAHRFPEEGANHRHLHQPDARQRWRRRRRRIRRSASPR